MLIRDLAPRFSLEIGAVLTLLEQTYEVAGPSGDTPAVLDRGHDLHMFLGARYRL